MTGPWRWAPVVGPALLALVLCLIDISGRSVWLDEGASLAIASQHGSALWHSIAHDGGNMLAYYLGLHAVVSVFGSGVVFARVLSALCAAGMVGTVGWIALRQVSVRAALVTGLLGAVSLPLVFWGQDIRGYAPMMLLVTLSYAALVVLVDPPASAARLRWAVWFGATVLAVYCSFAAALVLPAQAVVLFGRVRLRAVVLSAGALVLASLPLVVLAAARGTGQLFWVGPATLHEFAQALRWLTSSGMQPNFYLRWASVPLMVLTLVVLAVVLVWLLVDHSTPSARARWTACLAAAWLVVPLVLDLAESLAGQPVLLTRNSLVSLPAVALALGCLLGTPRVHWVVAVAVCGAVLGLRAAVLVPTYGRSPEDWRAAAAYVLGSASSGDCIAFYPQDGRMPFRIYVHDTRAAGLPRPVLPSLPWPVVRPYVESYRVPGSVARATTGCPRTWLVVSHAGQRHGPAVSRVNFARYLGLRAALGSVYRSSVKRSFGWAASVDVTLLSRRRR